MVGEQIHLVDVEHAAVRGGEQPGSKRIVPVSAASTQLSR